METTISFISNEMRLLIFLFHIRNRKLHYLCPQFNFPSIVFMTDNTHVSLSVILYRDKSNLPMKLRRRKLKCSRSSFESFKISLICSCMSHWINIIAVEIVRTIQTNTLRNDMTHFLDHTTRTQPVIIECFYKRCAHLSIRLRD